jgi:anti-sigma-K factor RskA
MGEHPFEDLAALALGSLGGPDRERLEAHVATCATCARRLEEYRAAAGALPLGIEPLAAPPEAWAVIRAAARERGASARARATRRVGWLRLAARPALALAIVSLVVWNVMLQREVARHASGPQVEALARRPGRLVILAGTGAPGASARLLGAADGGHGHLAVAGLTPLPSGRIYQLWFIRPGAPPVTGGTFTVDGRGRAWASVDTPIPLEQARAISVTEEPAPGSEAPTGKALLYVESWR